MNRNYKLLFKNIGYLTISNFASKILVFLLVPVYTSILSTEEYGVFDAIVMTIQLAAPIVTLNISDGVMRFLLDNKIDTNIIRNVGLRYTLLGLGLIGCFSIFSIFAGRIPIINGNEWFWFLYGTFYILNQYYLQFSKGIGKVKVMAIGGVIGTVSMLSTNILFLLVFKCGLPGFFISNTIGLAFPVLYYSFALKEYKFKKCAIDRSIEKEMLIYSIPLLLNTIGWTINSSLDKYCLIALCGIEASALVAVAYKIPTILSVIYAIFTQAWQISAVCAYKTENYKAFYSDTFVFINGVGVLLCSVLILGNKILAGFLFSGEFFVAWKYVPFLLISVLFNQTAGFVGPLLSAKKESGAMAKAAIIGSIFNLVLNVILIKLIDIQGAAVATAISSFTIYFVRWWYARDLLESRIYRKLYASWVLVLISALAEILIKGFMVQVMVIVVLFLMHTEQIGKILRSKMKGKVKWDS